MDPFGAFTDEDIWEALEKAHLKQKVSHDNVCVTFET